MENVELAIQAAEKLLPGEATPDCEAFSATEEAENLERFERLKGELRGRTTT